MFETRFFPSKRKMSLQDWLALALELVIRSEVIDCIDNFTYLGSLIIPNCLVSDEISSRV